MHAKHHTLAATRQPARALVQYNGEFRVKPRDRARAALVYTLAVRASVERPVTSCRARRPLASDNVLKDNTEARTAGVAPTAAQARLLMSKLSGRGKQAQCQAAPPSRKQSASAAVSARAASDAAAVAAPARVFMPSKTTLNQVDSNTAAFKLANGMAWLSSGLISRRVSGRRLNWRPGAAVLALSSTARPWPQAVSAHLQNEKELEELKQGMKLIHLASTGSLDKAAAKSGWLQNLTKPPTRGCESQGDLAPRAVQAMRLSEPAGRSGKSLDCQLKVKTSIAKSSGLWCFEVHRGGQWSVFK
jgi:hypothetical protein